MMAEWSKGASRAGEGGFLGEVTLDEKGISQVGLHERRGGLHTSLPRTRLSAWDTVATQETDSLSDSLSSQRTALKTQVRPGCFSAQTLNDGGGPVHEGLRVPIP